MSPPQCEGSRAKVKPVHFESTASQKAELPRGFMKVRYYGFLSPSFAMPLEEVKARIEMARVLPRARPKSRSKRRCRCAAAIAAGCCITNE